MLQACEISDRSQAHRAGASQRPRERHLPPQMSANLLHYLAAAQTETENATKAKQKPRQVLSRGIACTPILPRGWAATAISTVHSWITSFAGLQNQKAISKPPNSKNAPKASKRPGPIQPASGTAKATKTSKIASTSKPTAPKATKTAQAKTAATTAAGLFSAGQQAAAAGATSAGMNAADANAVTDPMKPADQAPKRDRKKASDINVEEAVAKVKAAKAGGTLAKLSLLELKAYLKSVGKPVGGKKADLMERVEAVAEP